MVENTRHNGFINKRREGLWRVAALVKLRAGALPDDNGEFLKGALKEEPRLVRLVAARAARALDPAIAPLFSHEFDQMVELWFESSSDAEAVLTRLDNDAAFASASDRVIDRQRSVVWLAQCFPIKPETGVSRIKLVTVSEPAPHLSIAEAQKYWHDVHPEVARTVPAVWDALMRYDQFHGAAVPRGLNAGLLGQWRHVPISAEIYLESDRAIVELFSNEGYLTTMRRDEEKFARPGEMKGFLADEDRLLLG